MLFRVLSVQCRRIHSKRFSSRSVFSGQTEGCYPCCLFQSTRKLPSVWSRLYSISKQDYSQDRWVSEEVSSYSHQLCVEIRITARNPSNQSSRWMVVGRVYSFGHFCNENGRMGTPVSKTWFKLLVKVIQNRNFHPDTVWTVTRPGDRRSPRPGRGKVDNITQEFNPTNNNLQVVYFYSTTKLGLQAANYDFTCIFPIQKWNCLAFAAEFTEHSGNFTQVWGKYCVHCV